MAQSSMDQALESVSRNNKTIQAAKQFVTAKKLEHRTGITPDNPYLSADFLIGKNSSFGNQFDFALIQSLDFPSVYFKKGNLADEQDRLLDISIDELRQKVLLETKETVLEIIYLNGQQKVVEERKSNAQSIVDTYQKKFNLEEINALELNKAKIQLLNIKSDLRNINSGIKMKGDHLSEMNGGVSIQITDSKYTIVEDLPEFKVLENTIEQNDPSLKSLNQQAQVSQSSLELKKAMTLPKFETGYRYQSVLGQTFNGVHIGLNIPLWQHKNELKTERAKAEFVKLEIEEHEIGHSYEIKELYENYKNLKIEFEEYQEVLNDLNSFEILKKSLDLGQMDFITYAMEINFFYDAEDQLKNIEKEYQLAIAKLYKYQL
ncbi:MAG: TolC family protein [Crocinitomicaceae bacterium]|nr:TolC family protein [Crocinitomicaceae bacterium]